MTTREMASAYRQAQWAEKIREQKNSGQNIRQWCEASGVNRQRYFYWQRKLRESACVQLAESQRGEVENGLSVPTGFAQVQLSLPATPPATENGSNQLQVEVGGVRLTAGSGYPAEQLARLVRELAGSC